VQFGSHNCGHSEDVGIECFSTDIDITKYLATGEQVANPDTISPTTAPTKQPTKCPTTAPTAIPTISMADFKASASDSAPNLLKSGHDKVYKYNADGTKLTLKVRTDADLVAAEASYKAAVGGFAGKNMPYMSMSMKRRYNGILALDAQSDTPVLADKTPYAISTSHYQGINGKKVFQGSCPAAVPAFANGVNGAKVVGKGPHGAHDENMSGSIVPVDCADAPTASWPTPRAPTPWCFPALRPTQ
jgi:hypothetical protein